MAGTEKYKVGTLAKDLGLKNKDIIDVLAAHGIAVKSHASSLEEAEVSLIFEHFTQKNTVNIAKFFDSRTKKQEEPKIDEEKVEKSPEKEEKAESPKTQEKPKRDQKPDQKPDQKRDQRNQKPQNRPQGQGGNWKQEQKDNRPAQNTQAAQKDNSAPIQTTKRDKKKDVRIVDTRGSVDVNLSKYDDSLDSFAGDSDNTVSKQKIKKKNNKQFGTKENNNNNNNNKKQEQAKKQPFKPKPVQLHITVPEEIVVSDLAQRMKITVGEVIKKLMTMGVMAGVNQVIDFDTAYLVADEFKIKVTKEADKSLEKVLLEEKEDLEESLKERAPVVVVMGHVDHGKTSLLDAIRHSNVTKGEAGGITQHIGAYRVNIDGKEITFLDTPGHEAFTAMRARGAQVTDIAVIVVAADDGIMPQTVEAINHAKAAGVSIIVAINKMDRPGADPETVKQELTKYDLVPEEWGGDTICVPVSALKRTGIDELLEMILLVAEMKQLKANPDRAAKGVVIEAKLDRGRGVVSTMLVQNGTLHIGDVVIAGTTVGRVRSMTNDKGQNVKSAGPSFPVEIMGLSEVPNAGDVFNAVADEKLARDLIDERKFKEKEEQFKQASKVSLDDLFGQISDGIKELNIVVKADVQGSAEAVKANLEKLSNEEVKVKVIHAAVGGISESDVMLAAASNAIIIGFNIRPDKNAIDSAARQEVDIRTYRIIYECLEEVEAAMKGLLAPKFKETVIGHAQVRQTIRVPNVGIIAGSYITDGKITRNAGIRVLRDSVVIFEDKISSLKRFKDDAKEVAQGYECGIGLEKFNDIKENDVLEAYIMEEIER